MTAPITATERQHLTDLLARTAGIEQGQYPNPVVGAVVLRDGVMVGEGYHRVHGGDHAEVVALRGAGALCEGATLVITLEPCVHHGKTGPCVEAIIAAGIARVIWAVDDPNPVVSGRAAPILRARGLAVLPNAMPEAGRDLIKAFYTFHTQKRPFVYVKAAVSLDGFIAPDRQGLRYISGAASLALVHALRARVQAICVGSNTIVTDQPRLSVRGMGESLRQPLIGVVDPHNQVGPWVTTALDAGREVAIFAPADFAPAGGGDGKGLPPHPRLRVYTVLTADKAANWRAIWRTLYDRGVQAVLVEGGAGIFASIFAAGAFDELWITKVPQVLGSEQAVPFVYEASPMQLTLQSVTAYGNDAVMVYTNAYAVSV